MSRESGCGWAGEGPRGSSGGAGPWAEPLLKGRGLKPASARSCGTQWTHLENGLARRRRPCWQVGTRRRAVPPPSKSLRRGRGQRRRAKACPGLGPPGPRLTAPWLPPAGQAGNRRLVRAIRAEKQGEKRSCGYPKRGVRQDGPRRGQGRGGRDPTTQPPRPPRPRAVPCVPPLSLQLRRPASVSPGGGARGAAGGAAGVSGAAVAHAPVPGAVQLPRPQLFLVRARPCTSLLNRLGGVGFARPRP